MLPQFNVIPCRGKIPLVKWQEFSMRRPSAEETQQWEISFPKSDKGIVCGPISRLFVLDDDGSEELKSKFIPRTATVKSPRGGCHYYFKWTKELDSRVTTKTSILNKVDVRGDGGFIAFYGWKVPPHIAPLAEPPKWLIDLLPNKERTIESVSYKPQDWMVAELESIQIGGGNDGRTPTFTRVIGRLKSKGLSEGEVKSLLTPWAQKYDYKKLDYLVSDQFKRYPSNISTELEEVDLKFSAMLNDREPVKWIVPGIIPEAGIGFVAGLPETMKTWVLMDLAIEFSRGGAWLNKFLVNQCRVLYIDQERGKDETLRRFDALISAKGISPESLDGSLILKHGMTFRLNLPQSAEKLERMITKHMPEVVIIDSFKTFHTKNEMSSGDMQELMNKLKELREKYRCAFLFVHHETKGVHQRRKDGAEVSYLDGAGTIDLSQTAEVFFNVVGRGDSESMLYHTKNTGGRKFAPVLVKIVDVLPDKSQIKIEAY